MTYSMYLKPKKKKTYQSRILTIAVTILQYIHTSNQHAQLKLIQLLDVNCISVKLVGGREFYIQQMSSSKMKVK